MSAVLGPAAVLALMAAIVYEAEGALGFRPFLNAEARRNVRGENG